MSKNKIIIFYGLHWEDQTTDWIPYGPLFIYSLLKNAGFEPILIHQFREPDYAHILEKHAAETLFFGVSAMTGHQITCGIEACERFKKRAPHAPVIWGGAHATAAPYQTLESGYADYVYVGPIKENIVGFARALQDRKKGAGFTDILSAEDFNASGKKAYSIKDYKINYKRFPRLAFGDFDFSGLITANNILNYTSSVGCHGQCTFCSWGGKHPWTNFPMESVLDDVECLINRYNISKLWFSDASLMADKDHMMRIAKGLVERGLEVSWSCNGRIAELNRFTAEDFGFLKKSGLGQILLGIESVNKEIQRMYRKIFNPETVTEIMKRIKDFDIRLILTFISGNPGGPLTDLDENHYYINKWKSINPNINFQVCMYTPYPGTPMTDTAVSLGYRQPSTLKEYGRDRYFSTKDRNIMDFPWFEKKDRDWYVKRYDELFSK